MRETWRWFGPEDEIWISEIMQTGAAGIVSALHDVPAGEVWPPAAIATRKRQIEGTENAPTGLTWDVVESLPVSETIKTQAPKLKEHLAAYKTSLRHLADAGITTVCYNFMPVLDWTRTVLSRPLPAGGTAMAFDLTDFAVFDLHVLKRAGAEDDYDAETREAAATKFANVGEFLGPLLTDTILKGLPGSAEHWTADDVQEALWWYDGITPDRLRANLIDFLGEVVPVAEEVGVRLCCHPDDPPFPLLGLPRVMSTEEDYATLMQAVPNPANGITFCTGSLGVAPEFDPVRFIKRLGPHIHFVHLRNTTREGMVRRGKTSFFEDAHLAGDTDMVATIRALVAEEARRAEEGRSDAQIPMRPDHGHALLSDLDRPMMPGYPLIGRLRGLAELRGVMAAVR